MIEGNLKMIEGSTLKTAFDEYTLKNQVGAGGNGRVFSAINEQGENFAIKLIERNNGKSKLKRLKNEIHFCECNKNKNIVKILDCGYAAIDSKEYVFYVMPLYAETLRNKMKAGLNPEEAVTIFIGLIEGLGFAHKQGTIHRDIKPENIMFKAGSLDPIICDFGIAHFAEEQLLTMVETKRGDRMANFQYAAPEQRVKGGQAVYQTDIYAAALILNEMFTGEIPQAADPKTIASVAPEYAYLDNVFKELYKQNPYDRLYPEEKILTEIKVRAKQHQVNLQIEKLQTAVNTFTDPEFFKISIVSKRYQDGKIVFVMDREIPREWFNIITEESFTHTALWRYGKDKLKMGNKNELCMPLERNADESTVKTVIGHVQNWIPAVNEIYSKQTRERARKEQLRKETERMETIEKLEKENRLAELIASL